MVEKMKKACWLVKICSVWWMGEDFDNWQISANLRDDVTVKNDGIFPVHQR